jgi:hypothetical protein
MEGGGTALPVYLSTNLVAGWWQVAGSFFLNYKLFQNRVLDP